jgi:hypothetical protein
MCKCEPGTAENGWHEVVSPECRRAQTEEFARAMLSARKWLDERRTHVRTAN